MKMIIPIQECTTKTFQVSINCWLKNALLGRNTIFGIMARISKSAKLSQIYTPHCVRASMISILFKAGVQPKEICQITKHKNEGSLNSYINGSTSAQKRTCSKVLGDALNVQVINSLKMNKSSLFLFLKILLYF